MRAFGVRSSTLAAAARGGAGSRGEPRGGHCARVAPSHGVLREPGDPPGVRPSHATHWATVQLKAGEIGCMSLFGSKTVENALYTLT